jgi:hypothetical protein
LEPNTDKQRAAGAVRPPLRPTRIAIDSCPDQVQIADRERTASAVSLSMHPDNRNRTYYIVVSRSGDGADPFCWEIRRRRHAMGVKVSGSGYRSYRAAHDAGNKALDRLLDDLASENRDEPEIK